MWVFRTFLMGDRNSCIDSSSVDADLFRFAVPDDNRWEFIISNRRIFIFCRISVAATAAAAKGNRKPLGGREFTDGVMALRSNNDDDDRDEAAPAVDEDNCWCRAVSGWFLLQEKEEYCNGPVCDACAPDETLLKFCNNWWSQSIDVIEGGGGGGRAERDCWIWILNGIGTSAME